ncbi:MAG: hypothetical protein ACI8UO_000292 [Verrucomicrobiales bacterium]|jgi:hypothetical protein
MKSLKILAVIFVVAVLAVVAAEKPVEVGKVDWNRDFDAALAASAESSKPVFALFQEVPGCAGCQKFGREVLSHPLIVEAIESEFESTVIYNNQSGRDQELLQKFKEPAWNYQVVRFFDSKAKDVIPRQDRVWTIAPLATRMVAALEAHGRTAPRYLRSLAWEQDPAKIETAAFAMFCFWTGEMKLGQIDGVLTTEAGWLDGREVTLVRYRADQISFAKLVSEAAKVKCADKVYAKTDQQLKGLGETRLSTGKLDGYEKAKDSDQRKQIEGSAWSKIRMTGTQATKVNAWARTDSAKALEWLSPRQRQQLLGK